LEGIERLDRFENTILEGVERIEQAAKLLKTAVERCGRLFWVPADGSYRGLRE